MVASKLPKLKPVAGGFSFPASAGFYPEGHAKAGARIQFRLTLRTSDETRARRAMAALLEMRDALVKNGRVLEAEQLLRDAALQVDNPQLFEVALEVASMVPNMPPPNAERNDWNTWGKVADAWVDGRLQARFPGKEIGGGDQKQSQGKDEGIVRWLQPFIGEVPLDVFNEDHYNRAMGNLPKRCKSNGAKRHYAQVILRVMRLARSCKLTRVWHLDGIEPPKVSKRDRPEFTCLYPRHLELLLGTDLVLFRRKLLWGFMCWESPRIGYLRDITWARDVDTDGNGVVRMKSKSGELLEFDLRPGTLEALLHMRALEPNLPGPFAWMTDTDINQAARTLRDDLLLVGVEDERVHQTKGREKRIRAHDCRATFVVFAKIEGRDEQWIMDRTGHTTSAMVSRYDRRARTAKGRGWQPLGRLDVALGLRAPDGPDGRVDDGANTGDVRPERAPTGGQTDAARAGAERPEAARSGLGAPTVTPTVTPSVTVGVPGTVISAMGGEQVSETIQSEGRFRRQESNLDQRIQSPSSSLSSTPNSGVSGGCDAPEGSGSPLVSQSTVTGQIAVTHQALTPREAFAVALKQAMHAAVEAEAFAALPDLTRLFESAGGAKVVELALRRVGGNR